MWHRKRNDEMCFCALVSAALSFHVVMEESREPRKRAHSKVYKEKPLGLIETHKKIQALEE